MSDNSMTMAPAAERYHSLDALRGVAILGIFAVNILAFAFPFFALSNPMSVPAALQEGGLLSWKISATVFQFKFITLFSMMFGAGIILMLGDEKDTPKTKIHRSRMFWLFIIGIFHNYLIWYGDILAPYAIAGFLVARARIWSIPKLIIIGLIFIALNFGLFYLQDFSFQFLSPEEIQEISNDMWAPTAGVYQQSIDVFRSGFLERIPLTATDALMVHVMQGLFMLLRTSGLMMIGMALFKAGFLTLRWKQSSYLTLGAIGTMIGLAGSYWGTQHHFDTNFDLLQAFPGQAAVYWASLIQSFGYAALVMAICNIPALKIIYYPFAAAGRMALSNYLASSLIAAFIFFGPPGLGKIGTMRFEELPQIVGGVWLFILAWSSICILIFRFGPAEWIWRTLTYGRLQPVFRKFGS